MRWTCFFLEPTGEMQGSQELYRRTDTGERMLLADASIGAMWYADWMLDVGGRDDWSGPDGHCLIVRVPPGGNGSDWSPDSRASNCTMPNDARHKCWVRHGSPPNITVDKNGLTCGAGAGSILSGCWHGFLRNGILG